MNGKISHALQCLTILSATVCAALICTATDSALSTVKVDVGILEGGQTADGKVLFFKGIPYAAPPVGRLRWKAPQPVQPWQGTRKATEFGPRAMQKHIYDDMIFLDSGPSEDCLYLNIWTPALSSKERLPVMAYIHGGGEAGSSSEAKQDGENLARKGIVVVSFNYRLNVFGFLSHPDLTKESGHHSSGNYAFLDQIAALQWVQRNIAAFGGDPANVTIFGESMGSFSVCALVSSPLTKGLFSKAIGESGGFFGETLALSSHSISEKAGVQFAASLGAHSIAEMRAMPAERLVNATAGDPEKMDTRFNPNIDGYFLPEDVSAIYARGAEGHVPLLAGWNADEINAYVTLGPPRPTAASFARQIRKEYGAAAGEILKLYPGTTDSEAVRSAGDLASDKWISFSTWQWIVAHAATANAPVYRYRFDTPVPVPEGTKFNGMPVTGKDIGARHAGEIVYVFGSLNSVNAPWQPADWKLSDLMMTYWTNFARSGNPNGVGLPQWPKFEKSTGNQVMILDGSGSKAVPEMHRDRYEFLAGWYAEQQRSK